MKTDNFQCDGPGCDHVKRECNHWFLFFDDGDGSFTVDAWDEVLADMLYESNRSTSKAACGEACLFKIISEHIKNATK